MKGNRLLKDRKYQRDIKVIPLRGKCANLIWIYTNEVMCGVTTETARGLAYDLLTWATTTDKKYSKLKTQLEKK